MLLSIYNGILTTYTAMNELIYQNTTESVTWKHLIVVSLVYHELHTRPLLVSLLISDIQDTDGAGINSS